MNNKWSRKDITDYMVCKAYEIMQYQKEKSNWTQYDTAEIILQKTYPTAPEKIIYAALERAYEHGLIEYGVSLRTGWLTSRGKKLLKKRRNI